MLKVFAKPLGAKAITKGDGITFHSIATLLEYTLQVGYRLPAFVFAQIFDAAKFILCQFDKIALVECFAIITCVTGDEIAGSR